MDKLELLSKKMDRIKALMDASSMNMEELLATAAYKTVISCPECPLYKVCANRDEDGCYFTWLKFLEGSDERV